MIEKFIIVCFFIMTTNCAVKLNKAFDLSKTNKFLNKTGSETEDTWQPIIQTHYWLPTPTAILPAVSGATESLRKNKSSNKAKEKNFENKNWQVNRRENNNKPHMKRLMPNAKLTTQIPSPTTLKSIRDTKIQNNFNLLHNTQSNKNANASGKYQSNTYLQQLISLNNDKTEIQYAPTQKTKNVVHREQAYHKFQPQTYKAMKENSLNQSQFKHIKYLADMAKTKDLKNSSSSLIWHQVTQAKDVAALPNDTNEISRTMNIPAQISNDYENINVNFLTLNSINVNESLINSDVSNNEKNQDGNYKFNNLSSKDVKYVKVEDKGAVKMAKVATADIKYSNKENVLGKFLDNSQGFNDHTKDKTSSKNYEVNCGKISCDDDNTYIYEDATNDDIDLEMLSLSAQQMVKATSITLSSAIAASLKSPELHVLKNMMISLASNAAASMLSYLQSTNITLNGAEEAKFQSTLISGPQKTPHLRSWSSKYKLASTLATLTKSLRNSSIITPTSKSSSVFSSGRKIKKVKKKLQQFLFPLLLAYKLKFMALLPLLAGGLILLVGSTGLAGFFFALFTAVMSLQAGHGNAVVVKKY